MPPQFLNDETTSSLIPTTKAGSDRTGRQRDVKRGRPKEVQTAEAAAQVLPKKAVPKNQNGDRPTPSAPENAPFPPSNKQLLTRPARKVPLYQLELV